jgi:hypothetical protein
LAETNDHPRLNVRVLLTIGAAAAQHFAHSFLLGRRLEPNIEKTRPGDFNRVNPALKSRCLQQHSAQVLGHLTRIELEGFGQLHGSRAGQIAMSRHFGGLKSGFVASTGGEFFQPGSQSSEQVFFNR